MAIQATLYSVSKDRNSTARPSSGGWTMDIRLKDGCSIISPGVIFDFGLQGNPHEYNYLHIPDFGRYYWINDWTYDRGLWIAGCTVDALASWRDEIGESSQYVARAAAAFDGAISDSLYPSKTGPQIVNTELQPSPGSTYWTNNVNSGTFVLGIVGNAASELGAVSYYAMTPSQFRAFASAMLGDISLYGSDWGDQFTLDFVKSLFNPAQYIKSCMWFPFAITGSKVSGIPFGWWVLNTEASLLTSYTHADNFSAAIADHPQIARGRYLNSDPYRHLTLYLQPFGSIKLPAGNINRNLSVSITTDLISGQAAAYVYGSTGGAIPQAIMLSQHSAQVGVPIGFAQISSNLLEAASAVGSAAASVTTGNALGFAYGVATAAESLAGRYRGGGSNGSFATYSTPLRVLAEYYLVCEDMPERVGRPLMEPRTVSTLPGFLQCEKAHFDAPATAGEIKSIEDALNAGIYWE